MLPLTTTTIAVSRIPASATRDDYDTDPAPSTIATGVRAHIGQPSGAEVNAGGSREEVTFRLDCDPTDLAHTDRVVDETTSAAYDVIWARSRAGPLDHIEAGLRQVSGEAAA